MRRIKPLISALLMTCLLLGAAVPAYAAAGGAVSIPGGQAVYDRGGAVYNVKAYGALGDGSANDTKAIQTLINDVGSAGGGIVFFPPGTYKVSALTVEANKVWLRGAGRATSVIATSSATANVITVGAAARRDNVSITDLGFAPSVTRRGGADIFAGNFLFLTLDNLQFTAPWDAIVLGQAGSPSFNPTISNIQPAPGIANGSKHVFLWIRNVLDGQVSDVSFIGLANTTGVWLDGGVEGWQFSNLHAATGDDVTVQTRGQGLLIQNSIGAPTAASYNRFTNLLVDLWYVGARFVDGLQNHCTNCWFNAKTTAGIVHGVTGGGAKSATGTSFVGGQAFNCGTNGVKLLGPGTASFSGFHVVGNNRNLAAAGVDSSGMVLDMDAGGFASITGGVIAMDMQRHPSQPQHHGIYITNRTTEQYFAIVGNVVTPNATANIVNQVGLGGGHKIRDNPGWSTESSGTGSVASGATTAVIRHGLSVTPAAADIQITPTNFSTNNVRYRVSAVGATTFTVEVSGDPGVSGFNFSWSARVQ
jgi:hypothetical protein